MQYKSLVKAITFFKKGYNNSDNKPTEILNGETSHPNFDGTISQPEEANTITAYVLIDINIINRKKDSKLKRVIIGMGRNDAFPNPNTLSIILEKGDAFVDCTQYGTVTLSKSHYNHPHPRLHRRHIAVIWHCNTKRIWAVRAHKFSLSDQFNNQYSQRRNFKPKTVLIGNYGVNRHCRHKAWWRLGTDTLPDATGCFRNAGGAAAIGEVQDQPLRSMV